ncbi:FAD-binding oxidoreductase [Actinomadura hibisca]|uniref:FAD-binding oxidoreductase n=1 Tax=Actinomadura hibisca TaxID=68565 RepID=UPI000831F5FE|nr:FAD-binding oxidoreductase [Actinomadura hibisca]
MERRGFLVAGLGALAAACSGEPRKPDASTPARTSSAPPSTAPTGPADWNALARGLEGKLIRPEDAAYEQARRLYIPRFDRIRPAGIAYCANPQDVAECMGFAARRKLPVAVRCGGHNYAGWSTGTGLVVDVSAMDGIEAEQGRAVVGAGVRLIDLHVRLGEAGALVPAGTCPTVGVSGLTLGGGLGALSRAYGLTCDRLESVQVVTPDGRVRECDARRDPELFWACRGGGGGNFGVATSLVFRTERAGDLHEFSVRWPWSRAADVLRGWQRWAPDAPPEIWSGLQINSGPADLEIAGMALADPGHEIEKLAGRVGGGDPETAVRRRDHVATMKLLAGCSGQSVEECHAPGRLPGQRPGGRFPRTEYAAKSHIAYRDLPDDAIKTLVGHFTGAEGRSVLIDAMGGAIGRPKPGDTAFPHRAARFCLQYIAYGGGNRAWLHDVHQAMEPYLRGAAYVNYMDPDLKDWRRAYYGPNLDRLARTNATYDPAGTLRFPQAL